MGCLECKHAGCCETYCGGVYFDSVYQSCARCGEEFNTNKVDLYESSAGWVCEDCLNEIEEEEAEAEEGDEENEED